MDFSTREELRRDALLFLEYQVAMSWEKMIEQYFRCTVGGIEYGSESLIKLWQDGFIEFSEIKFRPHLVYLTGKGYKEIENGK